MNDLSNYTKRADLLAQVADSAEEDAHVRRVLGARVNEAELDEYEQWRRAPFPIGATNHAHRYSACKSGPCNGGTKLCPSPEACGCAETDDRIARVGVGVVLIVVAVLMAGAIVTTALILSGAWL